MWASISKQSNASQAILLGGTVKIPTQSISQSSQASVKKDTNIMCLSKKSYDDLTCHITNGFDWNQYSSIRILGPGQARRKWLSDSFNENKILPGNRCSQIKIESLIQPYSQTGSYTILIDTLPNDWESITEVGELECNIRNWLECLKTIPINDEGIRDVSFVFTNEIIQSDSTGISIDDDYVNKSHPCVNYIKERTGDLRCSGVGKQNSPEFDSKLDLYEFVSKQKSMTVRMILYLLDELNLCSKAIERCKNMSVWMTRNLKKLPEQTYPYSITCNQGECSDIMRNQVSNDLLTPLHIKISSRNGQSVNISNPTIYSDGHVEFSVTTRSTIQKYIEIDIRAIYNCSIPASDLPVWFNINGNILGSDELVLDNTVWNINNLNKIGEDDDAPYLHRTDYFRDELMTGFVNAKTSETELQDKSASVRENIAIGLTKHSHSCQFITLPNKLDQYIKQVSLDEGKCDKETLSFIRDLKRVSEQIRNYWFGCLSYNNGSVSYSLATPPLPDSITRQQSCSRSIFS